MFLKENTKRERENHTKRLNLLI